MSWSNRRSSSSRAAPFQVLLDRLLEREDAPIAAIPHWRLAPALDYPAVHIPPVSAAAAAARLYGDAGTGGAAAKQTPRSLEEAVAWELQLSDALEAADLGRVRRTFAYRNHPDRVGPAYKQQALQRMTVANALIDQALKAARSRAGRAQ